MDEPSELLDIAALERKLHVSRSTVFRLMKYKKLPFVKIGARTLRFDNNEIERWVQEQKSA